MKLVLRALCLENTEFTTVSPGCLDAQYVVTDVPSGHDRQESYKGQ